MNNEMAGFHEPMQIRIVSAYFVIVKPVNHIIQTESSIPEPRPLISHSLKLKYSPRSYFQLYLCPERTLHFQPPTLTLTFTCPSVSSGEANKTAPAPLNLINYQQHNKQNSYSEKLDSVSVYSTTDQSSLLESSWKQSREKKFVEVVGYMQLDRSGENLFIDVYCKHPTCLHTRLLHMKWYRSLTSF